MRSFIYILVAILLRILEVQGFNLKCSYQTGSWSYAGHVKTCKVQSLSIKSPHEVITSINDAKQPQSDTRGIDITSQVAFFMPTGFETFFPNIWAIRIYNSKLESISQEDLKPFPELKELDLTNNQLEVLEGNLFIFNLKLQYINLNYNPLKNVGEDLLTPLKSLQQANFQECGCVNSYSHYNSHDSLKSLLKNCPSKESVIERFCEADFEVMREAITDLEELLHMEKNDNAIMKKKLIPEIDACDSNLDSATKNLFLASKNLKACSASNKEFNDIVTQSSQNFDLTCVASIDNLSLEKSCNVCDLKIEFRNSMIKKVQANDGETISGTEVKSLNFETQKMLFLPLNLAEFFPSMTELVVVGSGLYEIDLTVFNNMTELTNMNLSRNKLIDIEPNTFDEMKNLLSLDLSRNNIEKLDRSVFKTLENLIFLDLQGNLLTTINVEVFEKLNQLKQLFLQNNKLKFISANLLSPLKKIEIVDLTNNSCINMSHPSESLKEVETTIIDNCIAPIELKCSFEDHSSLDEWKIETSGVMCKADSLIIDYPKTKILKLSGGSESDHDASNVTTFSAVNQSIKFLPFKLGLMLPNLELIFVERSKLTSLQKNDFGGLEKLKRIVVRHNNLSNIDDGAFDDALQLEHLDLSHNNIIMLPPKLFLHLINMKTLVLSFNDITKFTADLLPRKNAIKEFHIDNNALEMIETKTLRFLRKATKIDLTANVCIDLKFDKGATISKSLVELSGEIDLNCSADD